MRCDIILYYKNYLVIVFDFHFAFLQCYGDSPATVPHAVNLGKANGLALAGESVRAMEALCEIKSAETRQLAEGEIEGKRREDGEEGVPLRSLVLLLENTQPGDCPRVGLKVCSSCQ